MRRVSLAAICALSLLLAPMQQAAAQTQANGATSQQELTLAMAGGGGDGIGPNGRQLVISSAVGWFSGGMIAYRLFRTSRATLTGIAIGTLFPIWVWSKQTH